MSGLQLSDSPKARKSKTAAKTKAKPKAKSQSKPKKTALATSPPKQQDLAPVENFSIILRGLEQRAANGKRFCDPDPIAAIKQVLEHRGWTAPEPRFSWQDRLRAVVLDLDVLNGRKITEERARQVIRRLPLQPLYWWISHSGGIKLIYLEIDGMTAEEVGELVCALLEKELSAEGLKIIEVKTDTRHPAYSRMRDGVEQFCSEVFKGGVNDIAAAKRMLFSEYEDSEFDPFAWEDWLAERQWGVGQRLEHTECEINAHQTKDKCVIVNGDGLYCFSCAAEDRHLPGIKRPGVMPARYLMDGAPIRTKNNLFLAVNSFAHFEQARWNFKDLPERRAKICYRAALKLRHTVDVSEKKDVDFANEQIRRVYDDFGLLRIQGQFCDTIKGQPDTGVDNRARGMPFVLYKDKSGKTRVDCVRLGHLQSSSNLGRFGYPDLIPLRGIDLPSITRQMQPIPEERLFAVFPATPPAKLRSVVTQGELDGACEWIEKICYPGMDIKYLMLAIAAKGIHQLSLGIDVARAVVTGPTMAGKTRTIQLAAIMTGEVAETPQFTPDQEKTKRAYAISSLRSTLIAFDEFEKAAQQMPPGMLLDLLLYFERGAQVHMLYKGNEAITLPGAVFLTSPHMPQEMLMQPEVCRRWIHVHLTGPAEVVDWLTTSRTNGIENWLTHDWGGENKAARDTIVSWVVNRYFSNDVVWKFKDIAADLGFKTLADSAENNKQTYIDLHSAYELHDVYRESSRWPVEEAWRVFCRADDTKLAKDFRTITDDWSKAGIDALKAVPWAAYLKRPGLTFTVKRCGKDPNNRIGLRFFTK